MVRFSASQSVEISVPPQPVSIEAYLSEPARLVSALVDSQQVEQLAPDLFRLSVRPIRFVGLSLQPMCDVRIWLEDGTVRLSSNHCELKGLNTFNEKMSLNMQGYLLGQMFEGRKRLRGQANLIVDVNLPPALRLTPRPLLERTGNSLINGILIALKQRLMRQLIADYSDWAQSAAAQLTEEQRVG